MAKVQLFITAAVLEGRSKCEAARGLCGLPPLGPRTGKHANIYEHARSDTHNHYRTASVDQAGSVTLRHNGRLHYIGIGRIHHRTRVLVLVQDLKITITNAATGEVFRELTLDPIRDYQPTGAPKGPTRKEPQT
jgi:hypothetical protein